MATRHPEKNTPEIQIKHYTRAEVEHILKTEHLTMTQFLQGIQAQGYLLHGSPNENVTVFEPRVPGDLSGGWTIQKGVYATSNTQPIIFALLHRLDTPGSFYMEGNRSADGSVTYGVSRDVIEEGAIQPGVVYIFKNEGFIENPSNPGEWLSPTAVVPVGSVPVEPQDLEHPIRMVEVPPPDTDWSTYVPTYLD